MFICDLGLSVFLLLYGSWRTNLVLHLFHVHPLMAVRSPQGTFEGNIVVWERHLKNQKMRVNRAIRFVVDNVRAGQRCQSGRDRELCVRSRHSREALEADGERCLRRVASFILGRVARAPVKKNTADAHYDDVFVLIAIVCGRGDHWH